MQNDPRSVFLIGMMGAGKSTVGRLLAQQLNYQFVDADRELEARSGVPIPTIFEIEGEAGFRRREIDSVDRTDAASCDRARHRWRSGSRRGIGAVDA